MRDSHAEWTVVYLGRRFSGAQIADAFVASLERNKRTASQVSDRRAATLIRAALTLRRTPDDIVLSVMVSPLLLLLWPLLRRSQKIYVIHDAKPHPGMIWATVGMLDRWLARRSGIVVTLSDTSLEDVAQLKRMPRVVRVRHPPIRPTSSPVVPPPEAANLERTTNCPCVVVFGRFDAYKASPAAIRIAVEATSSGCGLLLLAGLGSAQWLSGSEMNSSDVLVIDRYLSEAEIEWLGQLDGVLLLPYNSATQSGVVARFMKTSLVPLGFAVGGLADQLRAIDRYCAVEPENYAQLEQRLDRLLADGALRRRLTEAMAQLAESEYERFDEEVAGLISAAT